MSTVRRLPDGTRVRVTTYNSKNKKQRDADKPHYVYRKSKATGKLYSMGKHPNRAAALAAAKESRKYQKEYTWSVGPAQINGG